MQIPANVGHLLFTLNENGHEAYIVGGAVRNHLLGLPVKDYDICTSARPEEVQKLFPYSKLVGEKFGVVLVDTGVDQVEVATFRKEGEYTDHRRPSVVTFGSRDEDAQRRDFTVNCMYMGLDGTIHDPYGGQKDLESRLLRCVGDAHKRFNEDALRIMRALRFAARLGFTIEPETFEAMKAHAADLILIAQERIRTELDGMLTSSDPVRGLRYMYEAGIMKFVVPEVNDLANIQQGSKTVLEHTFEVVSMTPPSIGRRLAALLHDVGKPKALKENGVGKNQFVGHDIYGCDIARERLRSLTYDRNTVKSVTTAIRLHMRLRFSTSEKTFRKLVYDAGDIRTLKILRDLLLANESSYGEPKNSTAFHHWYWAQKNPDQLFKPPLPVNGFDLENMGLKGEMIGYAITRIREKWFEKPDMIVEDATQIARGILLNPPEKLKRRKQNGIRYRR